MKQKRHQFDIKLNSIQDTDNPTRKEVEFILHDFDLNHNGSFISKETALKTLHTLEDMPLVCKYYSVSEPGADDDALGSHEVSLGQDRETGDYIIDFNTVPIGVFTEPAYITTIKEDGEEKEVVAGKGILWASRFPNVVGLLKEWNDSGVEVVSSMEILYDSYLFEDGKEEILSYVYEGHCLLNSEDRGGHEKVLPAYDVSKLTRLVAQAIGQGNNSKEGEKMEKFKKIFELSHNDIRSQLYREFDVNLHEDEYSWIVDTYDSHFIVNIFGNGEDKYFKYNYTKTENDVEINYDSKTEVMEKREWVELEEVKNLQAQLDEKSSKLEEMQTQLNEVTEAKEDVQNKFNEASEKVTGLNSQLEELKPFKEKFEKAEQDKALEEKQSFYSAKFSALGATEKYDSEEVQALVEKSIFDNEEGKNAIFELNTILIDLVESQEEVTEENTVIRETSTKRKDLIPSSDDFESRYSK